MPAMIAAARENSEDEDSAAVATRSQMLQTIVETYIVVFDAAQSQYRGCRRDICARRRRARTVGQKALAASSARMIAKDPALAELVRIEQDHGKQINALLGTLNNTLSMPAAERDEATSAPSTQRWCSCAPTARRRGTTSTVAFPPMPISVDPKPPAVEHIAAALRPDEALLSFYFGRDGVSSGPFPRAAWSRLRRARHCDRQSRSRSSGCAKRSIPGGHNLRHPGFRCRSRLRALHAAAEAGRAGWKSAKNLVVVTNGALGLLPLACCQRRASQVEPHGAPTFPAIAKRAVVRTHSRRNDGAFGRGAAHLATLPSGPATRGKLIAFGDPYFSETQATEAERQTGRRSPPQTAVTTRGLPLKRRAGRRPGRRQRRARRVAAPARHRRRIAFDRAGAGGRSRQGAVSRQGRERERRTRSLDLSGFKSSSSRPTA